MTNDNLFVQFLQRLFTANPKFFKYVQYMSIVIAAISFLMDAFHQFGAAVPAWLQWLNTSAIKVSAITAIIMAQLPNKDVNK